MESGFTKTVIITFIVCLNAFAIEFKSGDLIFRRGNGFVSDFAAKMSRSDKSFSHVGIILVENGVYVIHSQDDKSKKFDGVVKERLQGFIAQARRYSVFRLNLSQKNIEQIVSKAKSLIGTKFDIFFNLDDNSRLYCTEFVYMVLKDFINIKIYRINNMNILPVDSLYFNQPNVKKIFDSAKTVK